MIGGISRTITYLQRLGPADIDLILEFSGWVLDEDGEEGLTIFTEDLPEVDALPRDKVLPTGVYRDVVPKYVSLVIRYWQPG